MKQYSDYSVFVFGAGGRQTLPICKGFYKLGCSVTTYCYSKLDTGFLTRYKTKRILYKKDNSGDLDFFDYGLKLIKTNKYSLVVSVSDMITIYLSRHKSEIENITKVAVNDWDTLQYAINKALTMKACAENHISAPRTIFGDDLLQQVEQTELVFPTVVKPRTGVGSIGFNIFRSKKELLRYLKEYDNANGPLLVQEYITQGKHPQYRADLFRTRNGEFKTVCLGKVTRWYPLDGGSGIFVMSVHDEKIAEECKKLLDAIHWVGYANIDMVYDEKTKSIKILEINGRPGASIKIDYVCGINISQLILENEMGLPVTDMNEYDDGKMISCFLPDLLWFLKSKDRFHTDPSWFKRWGVKDVIFSWDDPLPAAGFLIESVRNFGPAMRKRRRA